MKIFTIILLLLFSTVEAFSSETESLYPVIMNNKWGYINSRGKVIIKPVFSKAYKFTDLGIAIVKVNNKYAYIKTDGSYLFKCKFDAASNFCHSITTAVIDDNYYILTLNGNKILIGKNYKYSKACGDECIAVCSKKGWQIYNSKGKPVSKLFFEDVGICSESLCKVELNNKYGFINKNGKFPFPPAIDLATPDSNFSQGLAAVNKNGAGGFLPYTNPITGEPVKISCSSGGQWGFINKQGKLVIGYKYEEVKPFSEGLAAVKEFKEDNWKYINKKGEIIINGSFEKAFSFSEGLAAVVIKEKLAYINRAGKVVIPPEFQAKIDYLNTKPQDFKNNTAIIQIAYKAGVINKQGDIIIPCQFDYIERLSPNVFRVYYRSNPLEKNPQKIIFDFAYYNSSGEKIYDSADYKTALRSEIKK